MEKETDENLLLISHGKNAVHIVSYDSREAYLGAPDSREAYLGAHLNEHLGMNYAMHIV